MIRYHYNKDLVQNEAWYATNRFPNRQFRSFELEKDGRIHGVSNGILDPSNESAEWPKVALGKELLRQAIEKVNLHYAVFL